MPEPSPRAIADEIAKTAALVTTFEPMARHTTFRIGGPADVFATVQTVEQLIHTINICREHQFPFFLLGAGSNILVSDRGIRGVVIRNKSAEFSLEEAASEWRLVRVDSGYPMPKFAVDMGKQGLGGCEFLQSIPGTMGGGVRQNVRFRNAGQFGRYDGLRETGKTDCYLGELVEDVEILTERGERKTLAGSECGFTYTGFHASGFAPDPLSGPRAQPRKNHHAGEDTGGNPGEDPPPVITRVRLKLQRDSVAAVKERLQQYRAWRTHRTAIFSDQKIAQPEDVFTGVRARQPGGATAGCVFFNVPNEHNHPTGRLIDLCGLKGHRIGRAEISPFHANYIVNLGGARASDVHALMELAKETVFSRFGVTLVEEVERVGEW
uniref:UDP-N-acetylenolpyruvoylglucosamine reductase n=1 Tax=Candidatus Kentrum sp. DK TaxID=2126562 RepID=A0A450T4S7_9GAMM|nr:MAG: UDP-N-acetylmuramate dehydrogenase [Candidatus Kentron sp. DK]VFJ61657.1 MAG: UDP-N-acetylmuramate dehydrogenase [Candidatus Kentron sp. DK]